MRQRTAEMRSGYRMGSTRYEVFVGTVVAVERGISVIRVSALGGLLPLADLRYGARYLQATMGDVVSDVAQAGGVSVRRHRGRPGVARDGG